MHGLLYSKRSSMFCQPFELSVHVPDWPEVEPCPSSQTVCLYRPGNCDCSLDCQLHPTGSICRIKGYDFRVLKKPWDPSQKYPNTPLKLEPCRPPKLVSIHSSPAKKIQSCVTQGFKAVAKPSMSSLLRERRGAAAGFFILLYP